MFYAVTDVLLAFIIIFCFTFPFLFLKKTFRRRDWIIVVALTFLFSLLLAFISIRSVWTPSITNQDFRRGEFDGYFPLSRLSYPLHMSVYHEQYAQIALRGMPVTGSVSFNMFLADTKVSIVNGIFSYPRVSGRMPLFYFLDFPFFNTGETFFIFLLTLFTIFNIIGALLGIALVYTLVKRCARR